MTNTKVVATMTDPTVSNSSPQPLPRPAADTQISDEALARVERLRNSRTPPTPRTATPGDPGEERVVRLYKAWGRPDQAAEWAAKLGLADLPEDVFARP